MIRFSFGNMLKNLLKVLIDQVNMFHLPIKFTAEYFKEKVHCLDLHNKNIDGELKTYLLVKPTDNHSLLDPTFVILTAAVKEYRAIKLPGLRGFVQIMKILINYLTIRKNGQWLDVTTKK